MSPLTLPLPSIPKPSFGRRRFSPRPMLGSVLFAIYLPLIFGGCQADTAVQLTVKTPVGVELTALQLSVFQAGVSILGPTLLGEGALGEGALPRDQDSVRILLDDAMADQAVDLQVNGLFGTTELAQAATEVVPQAHQTITASVTLIPAAQYYACTPQGCEAVGCIPSGEERCDGFDNDCNGVVDDLPGALQGCIVGQGACQAEGILRCQTDGPALCDAQPGTPSIEVCNEIDDDCNGVVDDPPVCGPIDQVSWEFAPNDPPETYLIEDPDRLEIADGQVRLRALPEGNFNLASRRPAIASSTEIGSAARNATDGDPTTNWTPHHPTFRAPALLETDLGESASLQRVQLHFGDGVAQDLRVEVSDTPTTPDLAIFGTAQASSSNGADASLAIDGDPNTAWETALPTQITPAWVEVDLGEERHVGGVRAVFTDGALGPRAYTVYASTTPTGPDLIDGALANPSSNNGQDPQQSIDDDNGSTFCVAQPVREAPASMEVDLLPGASPEETLPIASMEALFLDAAHGPKQYRIEAGQSGTTPNLARTKPVIVSSTAIPTSAAYVVDADTLSVWSAQHPTARQEASVILDVGEEAPAISALNAVFQFDKAPANYVLEASDVPTSGDLAFNHTHDQSSEQNEHGAGFAIDGNPYTFWETTAAPSPEQSEFLRINLGLGGGDPIAVVRLVWEDAAHAPTDFVLQASDDGFFQNGVVDLTSGSGSGLFVVPTPVVKQYIRLQINNAPDVVRLYAFEVYSSHFEQGRTEVLPRTEVSPTTGGQGGMIQARFSPTTKRFWRLRMQARDPEVPGAIAIRDVGIFERHFDQNAVTLLAEGALLGPTSSTQDAFSRVNARILRYTVLAGGADDQPNQICFRELKARSSTFEKNQVRVGGAIYGQGASTTFDVTDVQTRYLRYQIQAAHDSAAPTGLSMRDLLVTSSSFEEGRQVDATLGLFGNAEKEPSALYFLPGSTARYVRLVVDSAQDPFADAGVNVTNFELFGTSGGFASQVVEIAPVTVDNLFFWDAAVVETAGTASEGTVEVLWRFDATDDFVIAGTVGDSGEVSLRSVPVRPDGQMNSLQLALRLARGTGEPIVERLSLRYALTQ